MKPVNRRVWVTQPCLGFMWTFGCGLRFTGQASRLSPGQLAGGEDEQAIIHILD